MNIIKPALAVTLAIFLLAGCTNTPTPVGEDNVIDVGQGNEEITLELPDFGSAGEEGEHSEANWEEFAEIADNSKFKLLNEGGIEYFAMFNEPYAMIYDPVNKAGKNWIAYYYPDSGTGYFDYDVYEMSAYNAGVELYLYNSVGERPLSGSQVLKNPDGTYSVVVEALELKMRYAVRDGLIVGAAIFESGTFMGYSEIAYGLDADSKKLISDLYILALENGETFEIPENKRPISEEEFNEQLSGGGSN